MKHQPWLAVLALLLWGYFLAVNAPQPSGGRFDFLSYYDGAAAMVRGANPYDPAALTHAALPFVVPPVAALVFGPLTIADAATASQIWFGLSIACLLFGTYATVREAPLSGASVGTSFLTLIVIAFWFYPVWVALKLGQTAPLLFCGVAGSLALRQAGRPIAGGMTLGFVTALKFVPAPLILVAALLGWRRYALTAIVTAAVLHVGSLAIVPDWTLIYWRDVAPRIMAINHSVNISLIGFAGRAPADVAPRLVTIALGVSMVVLAIPMLLSLREEKDADVIVGLTLTASVLGAPLLQNHYLLWLLMPVWTMLQRGLRRRDRRRLIALAAAFVLLSQPYRLARVGALLMEVSWNAQRGGEALLMTGVALLFVLQLTDLSPPVSAPSPARPERGAQRRAR